MDAEEHEKDAVVQRTAGMLITIAAIFIVLHQYEILKFLVPLYLIHADMSYWFMFLAGLAASAYCVAMCGGINLSQCSNAKLKNGRIAFLRSPILYNLGRVVSYAVSGCIAGALGSAFSLSFCALGFLKLIAGAFMVVMGIAMLNLFPKPRRFANGKCKNPPVAGLLNGLMPCAPLHIARIYALSTGSPAKGALAMALFAFGTMPLMFGFGTLGSLLKKKHSQKMMTACAVMTAVFGLCMLSQSWNLFGIRMPPVTANASDSADIGDIPHIDIDLGPQIIKSTLRSYDYPSIKVEPHRKVRWIIDAPAGNINVCNYLFVIKEYGIEHRFKPGENIIEFTPQKEGRVTYTCRTGMITGTITVIRDAALPEKKGGSDERTGSRCC